MWREIEPALRAIIGSLQEGAKQLAFAAARAAATKAALHRGPEVALLGLHGVPGPDCCRSVHRFHDLPFFDLPGLALPDLPLWGLRTSSRGLRPGRDFDG